MELATERVAHVAAVAAPTRVIAVASGKGGVGKSTIVTNMAVGLMQLGRRVVALDGDLGLANLDITFGVTPRFTFLDLFEGRINVEQLLTPTKSGVHILPACSGRFELANLNDGQRYNFFQEIDHLMDQFDTLLVDTGAGIGANTIGFAAAAQEVIVVANPEPTTQADAYAFIKVLCQRSAIKGVYLISNLVQDSQEGEEIYERLSTLCDRFLGVSVYYLGPILRDKNVSVSIHRSVPLLLDNPQSMASQCIVSICRHLVRHPRIQPTTSGIRLFWKRFAGEKVS